MATGVINKTTGDLLRAGFVNFNQEPTFNSSTEEYRTDVPMPFYIKRIGGAVSFHRWTGSAWVLIAQGQPIDDDKMPYRIESFSGNRIKDIKWYRYSGTSGFSGYGKTEIYEYSSTNNVVGFSSYRLDSLGNQYDIVTGIRAGPALHLPGGYVQGGKLVWKTNSTLEVGTSGATSVVRDHDDTVNIIWSGTLPVDITASGAGGLDTGTEQASTWMAVYVIYGDEQAPASMLSTNTTTPTLPFGYSTYRRIGWVRNNANSNFLIFLQTGQGATRNYHWAGSASNFKVLDGGTATSFTKISCSTVVPPMTFRSLANFGAAFTNTLATDNFRIRPPGTSAAVPLHTFSLGSVSSTSHAMIFSSVLDSSQDIEYRVKRSANSLDLYVTGFVDEM